LVHKIQDDIVALVTEKSRSNTKRNFKRRVDEDEDKPTNARRPKLKTNEPSWICHFKSSAGVKYKVGDTKEFKGKTYHYCDAPHCARIKWYTHCPVDCCVCQKFLQKKSVNEDTSTNAPDPNLAGIIGNDSSLTQESNANDEYYNADPLSSLHELLARLYRQSNKRLKCRRMTIRSSD